MDDSLEEEQKIGRVSGDSPLARSTFQGCEYRIWTTTRLKVLRK